MPEGGSQKEAHYRPDHGENSVHFVLSPYYPSLLGVMGGVNPSRHLLGRETQVIAEKNTSRGHGRSRRYEKVRINNLISSIIYYLF